MEIKGKDVMKILRRKIIEKRKEEKKFKKEKMGDSGLSVLVRLKDEGEKKERNIEDENGLKREECMIDGEKGWEREKNGGNEKDWEKIWEEGFIV